jgi:cyclic-di-AMP phosphodiesterase PgpH
MALFGHKPKKTRKPVFPQRPHAEEEQAGAGRRWMRRAVVAGAFMVLTAAVTRAPESRRLVVDDIDTSVVANEEIRAGFYFETVNLSATNEARKTAAEKIPDYYRIDVDRVQRQLDALAGKTARVQAEREGVRETVMAALRTSDSSQPAEDVVRRAVSEYVAGLKEEDAWAEMPEAPVLEVWLTPDMASLPEREFAGSEESGGKTEPAADKEAPRPVAALKPAEPEPIRFSRLDQLRGLAEEALRYVLTQGVRQKALPAEAADERIVILRDAPLEDQQVSSELRLAEVPDPEQAVEGLNSRLLDTAKRADRESGGASEWARLHEAALAMTRPLVTGTIQYDNVYTAGARERARESVAAELRAIEAGEIIQDRGKRWTPQSRSDVKTYMALLAGEQKPMRRWFSILLAHIFLVGLVLAGLLQSVGIFKPRHDAEDISSSHLYLALLLMAAAVIAGRIGSWFEPTGFVIPVAAVGILYAILVNVRLAALLSTMTAVLISVQYGYDWRILMVGSAMSLAGVFSIYQVRRRSDMATASLKATITGLIAMVAISLTMDSLFSEATFQRIVLIVLNGAICLLAVPGLLSPLERLFGVTTDIQLLEYSDLNNEVLSQLAIKAPATYAHSLMLGQLAEAASEAIGANGLLARVCAYYHDIGKMKRSEYFCENQTGRNIHDELPPRLSARAISSHITLGAEMAREYHLPKPIVDGILEHHGTCRIGFFYEQAVEQQKHGDVREADFRYPGPKPQRPETAILMICDAVESGIRSIKNPNEERVREFIDKIIAARSADRQFDDCNLTLKQLNTIAEVIARRMATSLHSRISYPDAKAPAEKMNNVVFMGGKPEK